VKQQIEKLIAFVFKHLYTKPSYINNKKEDIINWALGRDLFFIDDERNRPVAKNKSAGETSAMLRE